MLKVAPRVYWDACAWIAFINKEMPSADNTITNKLPKAYRAAITERTKAVKPYAEMGCEINADCA